MTQTANLDDHLELFGRWFCIAAAGGFEYIAWTLRLTDRGAATFAVGAAFLFLVVWGIQFWIQRIKSVEENERLERPFGVVIFASIWLLVTLVNWWGAVSIFPDLPGLLLFGAAALIAFWPSAYFGRSIDLPVASSIQRKCE